MRKFIFIISFFFSLASCSNDRSSNAYNTAIQNASSSTLKEQDIFYIIQEFSISTVEKQNLLLRDIYPKNKKLAETLIIYRRRLSEVVSQPKNLKQMMEKVFLHYVINTDGALPNMENATWLDIVQRTKNYAQSLGLSVTDSSAALPMPTLTLAERKAPCTDCLGNDYNALRNSGIEINKMRYGRPDVIPSTAFSFIAKDSGYSLENAMILADFSNLAYFKKPFVITQLELWNYTLLCWFEDKETDTQGFVAQKDDYFIICFRGTNSITDMVYDAWFTKVPALGGKGKVHKGFQKALESIWPQLIKKLDKNTRVFVTGHSLGGALALLAAHQLTIENYTVAAVYTFGAPRVGNGEFKKTFNNLLKHKTFLHINYTDIVPTAAPEILGFAHPGKIRTFNKDHEIIVNANDAGTTNEVEEKNFNDLDAALRKKIRIQMKAVNKSIIATTNFMKTAPNGLNAFSYTTEFEDGKLDNHGVDQYLFKLACAIVDKEWQGISNSRDLDFF
jgi:triacylglycerol lipase